MADMKIGNIKVGFSQANTPPPLNYRKFMNFIFVVFFPATFTFILAFDVSEHTQKIISAAIIYTGALAKGFAFIIGNGQKYIPSNEIIEKRQSDSMKFIFWLILINGIILSS